MRSALGWLGDAVPAWFSIEELGGQVLVGRARLPKAPWGDGLHLRIFGDTKPKVCEMVPGTDLPARCPERHVQFDKTFCLGLRYLTVRSVSDAENWWTQLYQFILCQIVAERTRVWPPNHALDHGDAGEHHERALKLASEAGLEGEYAAARLGEPSWITDPKLHLYDRKGDPINGRAPCPRGCLRRARGRVVRTLRTDCDKRALVVQLSHAESKRRVALEEYWQHVIAEGVPCCRTMRDCRLAEREDEAARNAKEGDDVF